MGHYQKQEKLRRRSEKKLARRLVCGGRVKDRYIQVKLTSPPPTVLPGYPPFSLSLSPPKKTKQMKSCTHLNSLFFYFLVLI